MLIRALYRLTCRTDERGFIDRLARRRLDRESLLICPLPFQLIDGIQMRRTGKYYYLNLIAAALPIVSAAMMCFMNTTPRWTDWMNPLPNGIGVGANGMRLLVAKPNNLTSAHIVTIVLIALLANVDRDDMAVGELQCQVDSGRH